MWTAGCRYIDTLLEKMTPGYTMERGQAKEISVMLREMFFCPTSQDVKAIIFGARYYNTPSEVLWSSCLNWSELFVQHEGNPHDIKKIVLLICVFACVCLYEQTGSVRDLSDGLYVRKAEVTGRKHIAYTKTAWCLFCNTYELHRDSF